MNAVRNAIIEEIKKIEYTSKELKAIYNNAQRKAKSTANIIQSELSNKNKELNKIEDEIKCLYEKKVTRQISIDKFKELYEIMSERKMKIVQEIEKLNNEIKNNKKGTKGKNKEYKQMEKLANEFLKIENPDNEILKKLVKRVVFDKNKKITVELTFSQI